jgi:glycosyltransferase involved in cell wall biosynthesis
VGFVGRLEASKGIYDLAAAIRKLGPAAPAVEVIGSAASADGDRVAAAFSGLRCAFLGEQAPQVVAAHMKTWSALALPSYSEGMPIVALEALSSGLAVAGIGGVLPESLVQRQGVYVASRDRYEATLVKAMNHAGPIENSWIPDHAEAAEAWARLYRELPAWRDRRGLPLRPSLGRLRRARLRSRVSVR